MNEYSRSTDAAVVDGVVYVSLVVSNNKYAFGVKMTSDSYNQLDADELDDLFSNLEAHAESFGD
jgi:hypothetical protein